MNTYWDIEAKKLINAFAHNTRLELFETFFNPERREELSTNLRGVSTDVARAIISTAKYILTNNPSVA